MPSVVPFTRNNSVTVWKKENLFVLLFTSTFVQKSNLLEQALSYIFFQR